MDCQGDHPPSYVDEDAHSSTFEPVDNISDVTDQESASNIGVLAEHQRYTEQGMKTQTTGLTLYGNAQLRLA
jgi:hypothetical protein